jgi:probable O-glycosylation ligase (exosortase A-associated)
MERFAFNPPSRPSSPPASAGQARESEDASVRGSVGQARESQDASVPAAAPSPAADRAAVSSVFRRKKPTGEPAEPRDWAFTWLLVFTAVLFFRPQDVFPPLAVLRLAEMSAIAGLVALLVGRLSRGQTITRMTPEFAGVIALGVLILLLAPFSIWFGGTVGVFTDQYAKVILVYLLAVNVIESPKRLERFTWVLVLAVSYVAFRAVFDYARGVNMIRGGTRVMGSVGGMMQNPNDLALNMVVFLPLAALLAMRPGPALRRLVAAACVFFMMGAVVASGSRGGSLGFVAMLLVLAITFVRQRPALVFAGALAVMCALPLVPSSYWQRIASITDESKDDVQSSQARRHLYAESFQAFVENPLTGVGAGQFKDWNPTKRVEAWHESHNVWLQVGAELGIAGVAIFLFIVFRAFYAASQTRRLVARLTRHDAIAADEAATFNAYAAAMTASLVGWVVCSMFSSVAYNWTFYYLLALAATPRDILRARVPALASSRRRARGAALAVPGAAMTGGRVGA